MKNQKLIVILGQTATGKSALAVKLARKFGGEIVSADSRQVYRGLALGTGKITKHEMRGVPHHMLDVADPKKQFDVFQYKKITDKIIADIASRGKTAIICGGTGLYIDAVVNGITIPEVPPNIKLRKRLENKKVKQLFDILKKLDPHRAASIDAKNSRRLIRAIEIATALGAVPAYKLKPTSYKLLKIGIKLPEANLKQNIKKRLIKRLKMGMVAEAVGLHKQGLSWKRMELLGLEYKYMALYLQKKISKAEMLAGIEKASSKYAKRQMTWFKRDKNIKWFEPKNVEIIKKEVASFITN